MTSVSLRSKPSRFVTALLALVPAIASATVTLENTHIQLGGFFSQGFLQSWGNNYPVAAKGGTFDFREMATNVSTTFGPKLRVGAQAFAQRLGNYGDDRVLLDWAVADYNFSQEFGIRVGRIKYPKGLYGEALDLDVVRPFIFLPGSIYGAVVRDFSASFDGAMTYGSLNVGGAGSVDYKVFYGDIKMNTRQGVADFFNNGPTFARGVEKVGLDHVAGTDLMWNTPVSGLRVGASYSYLKELFGAGTFAYVPGVVADIRGTRYEYFTFSTEYVIGGWTFAGEYQRTRDTFTVTSIGPKIISPNATRNFYVAASRRLNRWLELGAYHSQGKNLYHSATNTPDQEFIKDNTLSIRFDASERLLFKLEGHYIDGQMNMFNTPRTPNPIAGRKEHTTLFAAKTTFSF